MCVSFFKFLSDSFFFGFVYVGQTHFKCVFHLKENRIRKVLGYFELNVPRRVQFKANIQVNVARR